ncbi:MAG: FAD-binding oxidoreductase [Myxococcota bacterium]|nr:FAD-binding oxidoreductase [Myxococcota bacterium]
MTQRNGRDEEQVEVLVIGAGVVGLSTARALARRGARVVVLDRSLRGGEGSRAAAGVAVPSIRLLGDPVMLDFTGEGLKVLAEDLAALAQTFPTHGLTRGRGILRPALDANARAALENQARERPEFLGRWVPTPELVSLEPALRGTPLLGAFSQEEAYSVDADSYLDALLHELTALGVSVRMGEAVLQVSPEADGVRVRTDAARLRAQRLVVACGAWSGQLPGLELLPIRPLRGQLVSVFSPHFRLTRVLSGQVYLAPWRAGEVLVGATEEDAGFVCQSTPQGMLFLLATLAKLAPALRESRFTGAWAGLRATTASGRPMIGAYPGQPRVFVASGHGGQGILTGGVTGRMLADLMEGKGSALTESFDPAKVAALSAPQAG